MRDTLQEIGRLGVKRNEVRDQLASIDAELKPLVVRAVREEGRRKIHVAIQGGITRPTLDSWLREFDAGQTK